MVSFDKTISPGGWGKIEITFNTSGYKGRIRKSALVETNDPEKAKFDLILRVDVNPIFTIKPWARVAISTSQGKPAKQILTLTNRLEQPVELSDLKLGLLKGFLEAELKTVEKGRAYELVVETKADLPMIKYGYLKMSMSGVPVEELGIFATVNVWKPADKKKRQSIVPKSPIVAPKKQGS